MTTAATLGPNPFGEDGVWLKTALHTHSIRSDGDLEPEALARHYEWAGFDVMAVTDHWKLTHIESSPDLLVITGAELAVDPIGPGRYTEILGIGLTDIPEDPGGDERFWGPIDNYFFKTYADLTSAAASINGQGGVAFIAHPYWSGLPAEVVFGAGGVSGMEVFNASCERDNGRGDSSYIWDLALEQGKMLSGIATDDAHYPLFDIGEAWVMVRAAERSPEAVLEALRAGGFYSSHGPSILGVERDGEQVEIEVGPCFSVRLQTRWEEGLFVQADHRGRQERARILARDERGLIRRARFDTGGLDLPYARMVAVDERGRRAWTNPV